MEKTQEKRLEVPTFVNKTKRIEKREQQMRNASLEPRKKVMSKKDRARIREVERIKRDFKMLGLGALMSAGLMSAAQLKNWKEAYEQLQARNQIVTEMHNEVVHPNTHIESSLDKYGYPTHSFNESAIGYEMQDLLEEGLPEEAIVYGVYCNMNGNEWDEAAFDKAINKAGFAESALDWAHQHGYKDMSDKELKIDVAREVIKEQKIENQRRLELADMLTEEENIEKAVTQWR